jgi:hypothetical protein
LQQRKAAAMKQQPLMGGFGAPPHGAHPTLLAQYQEYASRLNHHISQMQRDGGAAAAGASSMGMGYPQVQGHMQGMQQPVIHQQQGMQQPQGMQQQMASGDSAHWEAAVKAQQEQHFQHLYMQWHFEQQMHQMGQWQQYQQQMAAAGQGGPPPGGMQQQMPPQYGGGSQQAPGSPTGAPPRAL